MPPGPPSSRPPRTDLEGLSEKYWGEILERTVSSNSLHALQRVYGQSHGPHKTSIIDMNGGSGGELNNGDMGAIESVSLSNFSNSEPKLCEHYHDINCAKNKAFYNGSRHSIKGLPDI